jgi:hypothetical protein
MAHPDSWSGHDAAAGTLVEIPCFKRSRHQEVKRAWCGLFVAISEREEWMDAMARGAVAIADGRGMLAKLIFIAGCCTFLKTNEPATRETCASIACDIVRVWANCRMIARVWDAIQ